MLSWKMYKPKSLYDDVIFAVDDFFDQWDPNTSTKTEEMCGMYGDYVEK